MKSLGDAFEHGCFDGCNLTRADLPNAYKLFGICAACLEGKFKLEPEPEADTVPAPDIGHTHRCLLSQGPNAGWQHHRHSGGRPEVRRDPARHREEEDRGMRRGGSHADRGSSE